jgi:hypothetical protein
MCGEEIEMGGSLSPGGSNEEPSKALLIPVRHRSSKVLKPAIEKIRDDEVIQ